jgi:hypothetical protein
MYACGIKTARKICKQLARKLVDVQAGSAEVKQEGVYT